MSEIKIGLMERKLLMALTEAFHAAMNLKDGHAHDEDKRVAMYETCRGISDAIRALGGNVPFRGDGDGRKPDKYNPEDVVLDAVRDDGEVGGYTTFDGYRVDKIDYGWLVFGPGILTSLPARNLEAARETIAMVRRDGTDGRH